MMINRAWMPMLLAGALLAGGCHAHASTHGYASGPSLVWIDAHGVWVVENQAHPVFYTDGFYWRFDNGAWHSANRLRSDNWTSVRGGGLPRVLAGIERPRRYARFEGPPDARRRPVEDAPEKHKSKKHRSKKDRGVRPPGLGGEPPPGHGGEIPGKSGDAPGKSGDAPGKSGNASGKHGKAPGKGPEKDKAEGKPNKPGRSGKPGGRGGKKGR